MGKFIFGAFCSVVGAVMILFMLVAYDMEVLSTGGRDTLVLSERVVGKDQLVAHRLPDDSIGMAYETGTMYDVEQISLSLWGRESIAFPKVNFNNWLRNRLEPGITHGNLYRMKDGVGTLIVH